MNSEELINITVAHYLESGDFNGLPANEMIDDGVADRASLLELLRPLIKQDLLAVNFGDRHPNPFIRAFPDQPPEDQLAKLETLKRNYFVLYPTPSLLKERVKPSDYEGRPFTLRLALGAPQLEYVSFDLSVIDHYRRDPRYRLWSNDVAATLSVCDDAYESSTFPEKHKVMIQHFGFSYDEDLRRAVAVFLTDLDGLSPEHQQIWYAYLLSGDFILHPDYYRAAILGEWEEKASLRDAFAEELKTINAMCSAIGWPNLFRNADEESPKELAFLIRPTVDEFNTFVQTLDKLLSDNINCNFFPKSIAREVESVRTDGKIEVKPRGTIQMLEEWLQTNFRLRDPSLLSQSLKTLREVRKLRSIPAHTKVQDFFDETLFEKQRQLFVRSYDALRSIRLILQIHPLAAPVREKMNRRVYNGEIWSH